MISVIIIIIIISLPLPGVGTCSGPHAPNYM